MLNDAVITSSSHCSSTLNLNPSLQMRVNYHSKIIIIYSLPQWEWQVVFSVPVGAVSSFTICACAVTESSPPHWEQQQSLGLWGWKCRMCYCTAPPCVHESALHISVTVQWVPLLGKRKNKHCHFSAATVMLLYAAGTARCSLSTAMAAGKVVMCLS